MAAHRREKLAGVEVKEGELLVGAAGGEVRSGRVERHLDERALRAGRSAVTPLLLPALDVVDPAADRRGVTDGSLPRGRYRVVVTEGSLPRGRYRGVVTERSLPRGRYRGVVTEGSLPREEALLRGRYRGQ